MARKLYNNETDEKFNEAKIINGNPNGIFNFNGTNHKWATELFLKMQERTWYPGQCNISKDKVNYSKLTKEARRSYDLFLAQLIANDSIQTMQLMANANNIITSPIVNACIGKQASEEVNHCLIEGTEILTSTGFINLNQLTLNDEVANYHLTKDVTFNKPKDVYHYDYDGPMYHITGDNYNQVVTYNHRVLTYIDGVATVTEASDFDLSINSELPVGINLKSNESVVLEDIDKLRLLYLHNGSRLVGDHYELFITKDKATEIEELFSKLDISYKINGILDDRIARTHIHYTFSSIYYLNNNLEWVNLTNLSSCYYSNILDYYISLYCKVTDDGISNELISEDYILDKLMLIAFYAGRRLTYDKLEGGMITIHIDNVASIPSTDLTIEAKDYTGKVYCCEVDTGFIICRYDGNIFITGNSHSYAVMVEDICKDTDRIYNLAKYEPELHAKNKAVEELFSEVTSIVTDDDKLLTFAGNQILEELVFPGGFVGLYSFEDLMPGTSELIQEIHKDETLSHVELFKNIYRTALDEVYDGVVPKELEVKIHKLIKGMVEAEVKWTTYASDGLPGFSPEAVKVFIEGQANNICKNLRVPKLYEDNKINPLRKILVSRLKGGELESRTNFFEGNVAEYSTGSLIMDLPE